MIVKLEEIALKVIDFERSLHPGKNQQQLAVMNSITNIIEETRYLDVLQDRMEDNERERKPAFDSFTDLEMIYYYVHKKNHMDAEKSPETKKEYARDLLQFYDQLQRSESFIRSDVPDFQTGSLLPNLRKRHIRRYQAWLRDEKRYALATRARKVVVIKGFLKWLYENEYIQEQLHTGFLNNEVRTEERPDRDLSFEEVSMLLDYHKNHVINYAILSLLATTGLRIREIANAKWNDLYYDSIDGNYYLKVIGKGGKEREALIFKNVFQRIQAFRSRRGLNTALDPADKSPLFTTRSNKPYHYKYLSQYVTRIIHQTDLPFLKFKSGNVTPHWFRHFFAIYSLQNGAQVAYIQQTLGHADIRTTQIYLDNTLKKKNNAARLWSEQQF